MVSGSVDLEKAPRFTFPVSLQAMPAPVWGHTQKVSALRDPACSHRRKQPHPRADEAGITQICLEVGVSEGGAGGAPSPVLRMSGEAAHWTR